MVKLAILIMLGFSFESSYASRLETTVKVKNVKFIASGQIVFEFERLSQEGFGSLLPDGITRLRFDFLKWPPESRNNTILERLLFWKPKEVYSDIEFETCVNWMIGQFKNNKSFVLGQTGGGKFESPVRDTDQIIVPYVHAIYDNNKNIESCSIDLG